MINDEALRKVLNKKVDQIKELPRPVQRKIESEMANRYNVKYGDTVDMFNGIGDNAVDKLPYDKLYKLMKCIYEVAINSNQQLDASDLNEDKYFVKEEIAEFSIPYPEEEKDFDLVITDWKQISDTKIKIFTNVDEVTNVWRNFNKLRFNPETQRDLVNVIINGKKVKRLDVNRDSIRDMKKLMSKGMYYDVPIIININPEISPLPYKDGKNLIIPKEAHMDLIEGFHNYIAMTELKDEDPNFKFDVEFTLRILTVEEANQFIIQMDKKNHFKPAQIVRIDKLNEINYIIDQLNKRSSFHLYGTIDDDMKVYLNKLLTNLYGSVIDRLNETLPILSDLENNLNYIIITQKHVKSFTKKEFMLYISLIKYSKDNNIEFENIFNKINNEKMLNDFNYYYEPTPKNIRLINKYIKEEIKNVV